MLFSLVSQKQTFLTVILGWKLDMLASFLPEKSA